MVYAAVITTVAEMQLMAGVGKGASDVDANHTILQDQAEAYLSALIGDDVATNIGTYDTTTKQLLSEWASRYAGMTIILNDMSGYTSRIEAENMVNVHLYRMKAIEKLLAKGNQDNAISQLGVA